MYIKMKVSVTAQWLGAAKPGLTLSANLVSHQIPSKVEVINILCVEIIN